MNRRMFLYSLGAVSIQTLLAGPAFAANGKILVAFFSASGVTKGVAQKIAKEVAGDLYEIMPEKIYTSADLNWNDKKSRSSLEMADSSARPKITGALPDLSKYDAVFLGYPIWWGIAPRILQTFVESTHLEGKAVIPFCTSGGSPFAQSDALLIKAAPAAHWKPGKLLSPRVKEAEIRSWAKELGLL